MFLSVRIGTDIIIVVLCNQPSLRPQSENVASHHNQHFLAWGKKSDFLAQKATGCGSDDSSTNNVVVFEQT